MLGSQGVKGGTDAPIQVDAPWRSTGDAPCQGWSPSRARGHCGRSRWRWSWAAPPPPALSRSAPTTARKVTEPDRTFLAVVETGDCLGEELTEGMNDVLVVPCSEDHFYEVYCEFSPPDGDYPGKDAVTKDAETPAAPTSSQTSWAPLRRVRTGDGKPLPARRLVGRRSPRRPMSGLRSGRPGQVALQGYGTLSQPAHGTCTANLSRSCHSSGGTSSSPWASRWTHGTSSRLRALLVQSTWRSSATR